MSYSTDVAGLLTNQLARFVTLNPYQLAGQAANLEFWVTEVRHALDVLGGYAKRFQRTKSAELRYVKEHETYAFEFGKPDDFGFMPPRSSKVPDRRLKDARVTLTDAARRFVIRCYKVGLIDEAALRKACDDLAIWIEESVLDVRT